MSRLFSLKTIAARSTNFYNVDSETILTDWQRSEIIIVEQLWNNLMWRRLNFSQAFAISSSIVWKERERERKDKNVNYIIRYQRIMTTLLCIFLIQSYWKVSFLPCVSCCEWKLKNFHVWGKQFSILDRGILTEKKKTQSAKKREFLEIKDQR